MQISTFIIKLGHIIHIRKNAKHSICHGKLIELIVLFKLKAFRLVCSDILFVSLSYIIHIYSSFHINAWLINRIFKSNTPLHVFHTSLKLNTPLHAFRTCLILIRTPVVIPTLYVGLSGLFWNSSLFIYRSVYMLLDCSNEIWMFILN